MPNASGVRTNGSVSSPLLEARLKGVRLPKRKYVIIKSKSPTVSCGSILIPLEFADFIPE